MYLKNSSKRRKLSKEVHDIKDFLLYYSSDMKFLEKAKLETADSGFPLGWEWERGLTAEGHQKSFWVTDTGFGDVCAVVRLDFKKII